MKKKPSHEDLAQQVRALEEEASRVKGPEQWVPEGREFTRSIIDIFPKPLLILDPHLKVVTASRSFCKTFMVTPKQLLGKEIYRIHHKQWDIPKLRAALKETFSQNKDIKDLVVEQDFKKTGHRILNINARRVCDAKKNIQFVLLTIKDATKRIQSEREHSKREERLKEAVELAHLGHWELDLVTDTLYWSKEIYHIFELDPQEFGGTYEAFLGIVHPHDRDKVNTAYVDSIKKKTGYEIEHRLLLKNGKVKYVHEKCKTEYNAQGQPLRSLGTVQDITEQVRKRQGFAGIIGMTPGMVELFNTIRELADVNVPVLIQGESGTGKELVAAAIHKQGLRGKKPFVPVNCSALPEGLLESELFGHVKGAFTGAVRDKRGRFELANGGTLFLDEVADLPRVIQAKLLRVLQEGTFERVGDEKTISVDVRLISAANRDLKNELKKGKFRDDLYYRISVVPIFVPPLRERKKDIPLLIENFLEKSSETGSVTHGISKDALADLMDFSWPGNVRELQSAIRYAIVKSKGRMIETEHLPMALMGHSEFQPARGPSRKLDPANVRSTLIRTGGNKAKAAKLLGVGRATLYRFLAEYPDIS